MSLRRYVPLLLLGCAAGGAGGCGGRPPPPGTDVMVTDVNARGEVGACSDSGCDDAGLDGTVPRDGALDAGDASVGLDGTIGLDGTSTDGISPGDGSAGDGNPGTDATPTNDGNAGEGGSGDVVVIPQGPCTPVAPSSKVTNEMRELPRPVYVTGSGAIYGVGARSQDLGLDEAFLLRMDANGTSLGRTNVSQGAGALIEGGALAPDSGGFVVTYSSNAGGQLDIYLRPMTLAGAPAGLAVRVSNDVALSTQAQVVTVPGGWLVVWRSQMGSTGVPSLVAAHVDASTYAVGAPATVVPPEDFPTSFVLTSDGTNAAVAYLSQSPTSGNSDRVIVVGASGAPLVGPYDLVPTGSAGSDAIAVAIRGTEIFAAWSVQPLAQIQVARMDVTSGSIVQQTTLTALGGGLSKPGAAADPSGGWVLAYRDGIGTGAVRMVRVGADLSLAEGPSLVDVAVTGDSVHIFAAAGSRYLVGWDDVHDGATTAFAELLQCP